jgi:hypothetical protein
MSEETSTISCVYKFLCVYKLNSLTFGFLVYAGMSRRMRWTGHVARIGEKRNAYRILVGKPEGKRPLGRARRRWVGNVKIDLKEIGCGGLWTGLCGSG